MKSNRLYFIDAVRAFAILMMLQGHFIDTLMDVTYRDSNNLAFKTWEYFRGITAPTFFTISGLIFSYLLIKAKHSGKAEFRMRKGLSRGLMLIAIGYALRIPFFEWLIGRFNSYFLVIDVLQCIGVSLVFTTLIYRLSCKKTLLFSLLMLLLGFNIFLTEPFYRQLELEQIPKLFSNYLTKANGSIFTIIPWFGYVAFGAFISTLFYRYEKRSNFKPVILISLTIFGIILIYKSSGILMYIYNLTDFQVFKDVAYYNYLFTRLGNVLILFALFYLFENYIKQSLILKIGQKTLSIYVIHFIIIYGSFIGFGLHQLIGKTLNPWQAIFGALLFMFFVCVIAFYYTRTNAYLYSKLIGFIDKMKKRF